MITITISKSLKTVLHRSENVAARIQEIDALRSIAIILIVFSHIDSFTDFILFERLDAILAFFGLSIFFFISGFLMRFNNEFHTIKDIKYFLTNRASKIYPLYWFSIIIVYSMNRAGFDVIYSNSIAADKFLLLLNILGLQGFFPDSSSLSVWWFVGTILLYYLLFSIVLYCSRSVNSILIFSFLVILPLLFLKNEFNLIQSNVFSYYFIFIAGILSATTKNLRSLIEITISYSIFLLIFVLISFSGINTSCLADISKRDIAFLLFAFIFTWYKIEFSFKKIFKSSVLVEKLADSSYSLYLFHIPVLTAFKLFICLLIPLGVFNALIHDFFMLFLGIPFTLSIGYFIMIYFDIFHKKIMYEILLLFAQVVRRF